MAWKGWQDYVPKGQAAAPPQKKPSKYRATPCWVTPALIVVTDPLSGTTPGAIRFDSRREAVRWTELKLQERDGRISNLVRQRRFPLMVRRSSDGIEEAVTTYVADFVYSDKDGRLIVEDAKGVRTEAYRLKRRHFEAQYGIEIREV